MIFDKVLVSTISTGACWFRTILIASLAFWAGLSLGMLL